MSLALAVLLLVASLVAGADEQVRWHQSFEAAAAAAAQSGKPIMAVFSAGAGCGWCTEFETQTLTATEVVELAEDFEPVQVQALRREDLSTRYLVAAYPTVMFLTPEGKVLDKVAGYLPPETFAEVMRSALRAWSALQQARALEATLADQHPTAEQSFQLARLYSEGYSFADALRWGRRALASGDPQVRAEALLLTGKALLAMDEPRQAIEPLHQLLATSPQGEMLWTAQLQLGYAYLMTDQPALGRPLLEEVAAQAPQDSRERADALRLLQWLDG